MSEMKINKLSDAETAAFCEQMSMILTAGISPLEGLSILMEDSDAVEEKRLLRELLDALGRTGSLAVSAEECGVFPEYMVKMLLLGEETGRLDDVMTALGCHYSREAEIARSVKNAVRYPVLMAVMMMMVLVLLLTKVMPVFHRVFLQMGSEMTGIAGALVRIGSLLSRCSAGFLGALLLIVVLVFLSIRTPAGRHRLRSLGANMRFIRGMQADRSICRFTSALALTLSGGMPTDEAVQLSADLCEEESFREKAAHCRELTGAGTSFSTALHQSGILSGSAARLASVGEKTGELEKAMDVIAQQYQESFEERISHMLSVLEPALVISISLIVGLILLSVMLPLLGIMSGI